MVDVEGNVPPRVMELLKIFLPASSRGEQAVLVLETKDRTLTIKLWNVECVAGAPAHTNTCAASRNKRDNPARVRRSQLRLEKFLKKKLEVSQRNPKTGTVELRNASPANCEDNRLILELDKLDNRPDKTGPNSPILQVDGDQEYVGGDVHSVYTFKSEYGEEDILYSLETIFPENVAFLISRKRIKPMKADHQCIVEIQMNKHSLAEVKEMR